MYIQLTRKSRVYAFSLLEYVEKVSDHFTNKRAENIFTEDTYFQFSVIVVARPFPTNQRCANTKGTLEVAR